MTTPWKHRYAQRMRGMSSSAIRELLKLTQQSDIISFAGGLPVPELFPVEEFRAATDRVLVKQGSEAMQYSTTEGYEPLREFIVHKMAQYNIQAAPENILITSGSQHVLDLIEKILINAGDLILTERPTYLGALQAWRAYQAQFVTVPIDGDGMQTEQLEEALCAGPKFMYILPNLQNPGGVTLSLERRRVLIHITDRYGIPIIEDDPYGELRFEGEHLPPLVVLDAEKLDSHTPAGNAHGFYHGNVIYLSTFSKTLAPGLRLVWIVAPTEIIRECVKAKQGIDLHTSSFVQMVAYELVKYGFLKDHVRRIRQVYQERRDIMLDAMTRHFPPGNRWTWPHGGLFLWVTLPEIVDAGAVLDRAVANKITFVPGTVFYPDGSGHNTLRLNFSKARLEQIKIGIKRLGEVLAVELEYEEEVANRV